MKSKSFFILIMILSINSYIFANTKVEAITEESCMDNVRIVSLMTTPPHDVLVKADSSQLTGCRYTPLCYQRNCISPEELFYRNLQTIRQITEENLTAPIED